MTPAAVNSTQDRHGDHPLLDERSENRWVRHRVIVVPQGVVGVVDERFCNRHTEEHTQHSCRTGHRSALPVASASVTTPIFSTTALELPRPPPSSPAAMSCGPCLSAESMGGPRLWHAT